MAHTFTTADLGCYFDNARGWDDIHSQVQDFAREYGKVFKLDNINEDSDDFPIWQNEATSEAEEYLNNLTSDDVWFGSSESGDWGLWHICDADNDAPEHCEVCDY
jgi:hypothetical protein